MKSAILCAHIGLCGFLVFVVAGGAQAQSLTTTRVASGLTRPLFVTHAPGDFGRIFVVEQRGSEGVSTRGDVWIYTLPGYTKRATPFLQVNGLTTGNEQGLLGLAFHPNYANNGYFYVDYTTTGGGVAGQTVIARYQRSASNPDVADPASVQIVLRVNQPYSNHNGGWIAFGPDGYLYIALGDGGSGGDPNGNGQNVNVLLGKLLRIDVDRDDFPADPNQNYGIPPTNPLVGVSGADEIWAYGLRNPWRNSFDRVTGDLWIADVGQDAWEEVDFQPGGSVGGQNYGWRCYEGNAAYNTAGCGSSSAMVFPILVYGHTSVVPPTNATGCAITGGYVYRGCALPALAGTYFFADYCNNNIFSFRYASGGGISEFVNRTSELAPGGGLSIGSITSFGEDAFGELYIVDQGGEVFKVISRTPASPDCNNNGQADACDILAGTSLDLNQNGIPDECEAPVACPGDCDCDGRVGFSDIDYFVAAIPDDQTNWEALYGARHGGALPPCPFLNCDANGDGHVNFADIDPFVALIPSSCP